MRTLKIHAGRYYRTRSGNYARIYATDGTPTAPVHGALSCDGRWEAQDWHADGGFDFYRSQDSMHDLVAPVSPSAMPLELRSYAFERPGHEPETRIFCPYCGHESSGPCCGENHCLRYWYDEVLDKFVDRSTGALYEEPCAEAEAPL